MIKIAGIDVGLKGGVVVLDVATGTARGWPYPLMTPSRKTKARGDARETDVARLAEMIAGCGLAVVELVWAQSSRPGGGDEVVEGRRRQGGSSNAKLMAFYGEVRATLKVARAHRGLVYAEVAPLAWKNVVLAGTDKDKAAAIRHVRSQYPGVELRPPPKRKDSDGIADAACLADFGYRLFCDRRHPYLRRNPELASQLDALCS